MDIRKHNDKEDSASSVPLSLFHLPLKKGSYPTRKESLYEGQPELKIDYRPKVFEFKLDSTVWDPGISGTAASLGIINLESPKYETLRNSETLIKYETLTATITTLSDNILEIKKQLNDQIVSKEDLEKHHRGIIKELNDERSNILTSLKKCYDLIQNNSIRHRAIISTIISMSILLIMSLYTIFAGPIIITFPVTIIFLIASILFFFLARSLPKPIPLEFMNNDE